MARSTVAHESRIYTVNTLERQARGRIYQSIVIAQLLDEITNEPLSVAVRVTTTLDQVRTKSAADGVAGVAGIPVKVFPELTALAYDFEVTFEATGYVPWTAEVTIPIQANFPDEFDSADLGQIGMRRTPISLSGTAVTLDGQNQHVPVDGANVSLSGIWRRVEDIDLSAPPQAATLLAISPGVYAHRPQPGSTMQIVALAPVVEPDRTLLASASEGELELSVSHSAGLVPGSLVGIDRADADRVEHIEVEQIVGPSDPDSPAVLVLRFPVKHMHREGVLVQNVTVPAAGPPDANLSTAAAPGDATVFVNSVAAFGASQTVRIAGGASVPEYANCRTYLAVSDADGHYRLPPMSRLAAVEVTAARAAPPPALNGVEPVSLTYALFDNRHDPTLS